ncbi:hypothetical protein AAFF_G00023550 [Aldrovandia affinis]|uniref:Rieske domain-containing protein n=1 Tax=Aldrovandia affinis TaxID=143900 RepID=A0AAD7T6N9_9TELE|nr:hypothetical protein AAFF_G00023550 [Aldrovandia affinis]
MSAEDKVEVTMTSLLSSLSLATSPSTSPPPSSYFIGRKEEILQARRVEKFVNGRDVLVLHHEGVLHAMDKRCYHKGGLLQGGDIEEFDGRLCIVCPWHKFKITLAEGEGLYQVLDRAQKPPKHKWLSKGVKQRVHTVIEVDEDVFVRFNSMPGSIDSDQYQTNEYRATLETGEKTKK